MTASTAEREAAVLHLWDEGIIRPESLGEQVIDALISEGWRPAPRVVSTVAELDALPDMSIIRAVGFDDVPGAFEKAGDFAWYETGRELPVPDPAELLPATVLWVGSNE